MRVATCSRPHVRSTAAETGVFTAQCGSRASGLTGLSAASKSQRLAPCGGLADDLANWAIFEPNEPTPLASAEIDEDD